jgi:hypothetical protein
LVHEGIILLFDLVAHDLRRDDEAFGDQLFEVPLFIDEDASGAAQRRLVMDEGASGAAGGARRSPGERESRCLPR